MTALTPLGIPAWDYPLVFVTGLIAGYVDSIAGGGGLITLPVLLSLGLPPQAALATNKLQSTFGSGSASWHYARSKIIPVKSCLSGILFTAVGAGLGTALVWQLDPTRLKQLIPVVLLAIAGYMLFKPQLGAKDIHPRLKPEIFYPVAGLALGAYDGFIGPGSGAFWTMALMLGLGFNLTKATACTKYMNFSSNLVSLAVFAAFGQMFTGLGLTMGAGQLLGARAGSRMVLARGVRFIRPIYLTMVFAVIIKVLYDAYGKP